jgi:putative ABC transport system permease protein
MSRHPRRTASTATALIVGVSIVTMCTVFAASLQSSIHTAVRGSLRADIVIQTGTFGGGRISPRALPTLAALPQTDAVVGQATDTVLVDGKSTTVTATDLASVEKVLALKVEDGSLTGSGPHTIAASASTASSHHWHVGSPATLTFVDGRPVTATVGAIYADDDLAGSTLVPIATWMDHTDQPALQSVLLTAAPGTSVDQLRAAVTPTADRYDASVDDAGQLASTSASMLDTLLNVVYVLLALAVLVALLGIGNALSLAVHERRYEIGLLRAVGQTRRQVRRALRLESAMVSSLATLIGLAVGTFLGWSLSAAVATTPGFALPITRLVIVALIAASAGAVAAIRPARRAARVPILEAVAAP